MKPRSSTRWTLAIAISLTVSAQALPSPAATPSATCSAAKRKAAANGVARALKCVSKAAKTGATLDAECVAKALDAVDPAFAKADDKGGCALTGDGTHFADWAARCETDARAAIAAAGQPAPSQCLAAKLAAVAKAFAARTKCYATAAKDAAPVDTACLAKARAALAPAFAKAEEGGDCVATADAAAADAVVETCLDEADALLCADHGGRPCGALASALEPTQAPEYYVEQANIYFDTLDTRFDPANVPAYSLLSARWELPPWLYLTGYGRSHMIWSTRFALEQDPSTVPVRDCRFFAEQPFARCVVTFEYAHGSCPIYEEFTFNDQGEMTFIEAWSDLPGYLPTDDPADRWGEGPAFRRLSTKVPGLGNTTGRIDLDATWMERAAEADPEVADFVRRAGDWYGTWNEALLAAGPDYFARGCGWVP